MINEYKYEDLDFRSFVLNENRAFLGEEIGNILTSLQEIQEEASKIGTKNLVRFTDKIVCQIRSLLGGHWSGEDIKFLKSMQKVGIALAKALEENDSLDQVISGAISEIESTLKSMNVPVNNLAVTPKEAGSSPQIEPANTLPPAAPEIGPETMSGFAVNPPQKPQAPIGEPPLP
jgi:hypothetical protein